MEIPVALLTAAAGPAPAGVPVGQLIVAIRAVARRLPLSTPLPKALEVRSLLARLRLLRAGPPSPEPAG